MSSKLRVLALVASLVTPAALSLPAAAQDYFNTPDAPLVGPTLYNTGSPGTTVDRQQTSGYFATPDASLVPPNAYDTGSAATTLPRQRASGYFPEAGAPLVPATPTFN